MKAGCLKAEIWCWCEEQTAEHILVHWSIIIKKKVSVARVSLRHSLNAKMLLKVAIFDSFTYWKDIDRFFFSCSKTSGHSKRLNKRVL